MMRTDPTSNKAPTDTASDILDSYSDLGHDSQSTQTPVPEPYSFTSEEFRSAWDLVKSHVQQEWVCSNGAPYRHDGMTIFPSMERSSQEKDLGIREAAWRAQSDKRSTSCEEAPKASATVETDDGNYHILFNSGRFAKPGQTAGAKELLDAINWNGFNSARGTLSDRLTSLKIGDAEATFKPAMRPGVLRK